MKEKKLYIASVMARKDGQYTHSILYTWQRSRLAAKNWFSRRVEFLYSSEAGWWTSTITEEVKCS